MKLEKALKRDRKRRNRRKQGRDGDSVKEIQRILEKRRDEILKEKREQKEEMNESK